MILFAIVYFCSFICVCFSHLLCYKNFIFLGKRGFKAIIIIIIVAIKFVGSQPYVVLISVVNDVSVN